MPRPKLTKTTSVSTAMTRPSRTRAGAAPTSRNPRRGRVLRRAINASTESDTNSEAAAVMPPDDITMMSGGLGVGDEAAKRGRSREERERGTELLRIAREADYKRQAGGRRGGVREKREADEGVIEGLKRRRDAKMGRGMGEVEAAKVQEEDFQPEDESTPLRPAASSGSMRARSVRAADADGSKRRKLSASQHTGLVSRSASPEVAPAVADGRRGKERPASAAAPRTRGTETAVEATMALPASSSAVTSSRASPLATRRGQAVLPSKTTKPISRADDPDLAPPRSPTPSPPSSPSTTGVTVCAKRTATATATKPAQRTTKRKNDPSVDALSTATLQNLLPRRRIRPHRHIRSGSYADGDLEGDTRDDPTIFDIPSHPPSALRAASEAESEPDGDAADRDFGSRRATKSKKASRKPAEKAHDASSRSAPAVPSRARRITKTYTRHRPSPSASSDKENAPASPSFLANDASSTSPAPARPVDQAARGQAPASRGLAEAARKFQEVDEWKLEFEDVSASLGGSSGLEGAR